MSGFLLSTHFQVLFVSSMLYEAFLIKSPRLWYEEHCILNKNDSLENNLKNTNLTKLLKEIACSEFWGTYEQKWHLYSTCSLSEWQNFPHLPLEPLVCCTGAFVMQVPKEHFHSSRNIFPEIYFAFQRSDVVHGRRAFHKRLCAAS